MKAYQGVVLIIVSTLISLIMSMSADMTGAGLAGLFNLFYPPFLGIMLIIVYLISCWITKKRSIRLTISILFSMYIMYIGFALLIDKKYCCLVFL